MSHQTCENLLSQLSDFVDGELEDALYAEIERHMTQCPDCRAVVNTLEKTIELYHTAGRTEVPLDIRSRLFAVLKLDDIES